VVEANSVRGDRENAANVKDPLGFWAFGKLARHVREYGLGETTQLIRKNIAAGARRYLNWRFDRKFRVDTAGVVQLSELTCESENKVHGVWYEPTPIKSLKCMFAPLPADLSDFTFVDYGSGKGRTLLYASSYNFRRIVGVEFAKELHAVAERNVQTYRNKAQKCRDITSVCMDAAQFPLPEGNCVLYFFHPFREEVMARVLYNIEQTFLRQPRRLIVLYYHPQVNSEIQKHPFLRKREERPMPFDLSGEPCPYRRRLEVYEAQF
jgi:16S rRNA G966 N2-methylase RsmD